jgi:hypothetical protein
METLINSFPDLSSIEDFELNNLPDPNVFLPLLGDLLFLRFKA